MEMHIIGNMDGDHSKPIKPTILTQSMKESTVMWARLQGESGKTEVTFLASELRKVYDDYQRLKSNAPATDFDLTEDDDKSVRELLANGETVVSLPPRLLINVIFAQDAYDNDNLPPSGYWRE
ncbi:hypothetical protein P4H71_04505 [Paenibacillus kribbensis]|uniref:hypothetical protein n=1 Tax=Paenibacillus kribbensis TaxID=172713 RepID=UPI002DBF8054|nr:hypothetical protein [Paenibacillus kribbensis]MEC0233616.1 hypothetical protein [Paenibacillus kribbensis]